MTLRDVILECGRMLEFLRFGSISMQLYGYLSEFPVAFCHHQSLWSRVRKSKANVEAIQTLLGKFSQRACFTRKGRDSTLLLFSDIDESVAKQHALISNMGKQIHTLLQVYVIQVMFGWERTRPKIHHS